MDPQGSSKTNEDTEEKNYRDSLVVSIDRRLQRVKSFSSECSIYRVPEPLRSVNPKAYTPKVISIGPLHRGEKNLMANTHKSRYLQDILVHMNLNLRHVIGILKNLEQSVRSCYAEKIEMDSGEFVLLLLFDGCFIVKYLIGHRFPQFRDPDPSFLWRFGNGIFCDLLLIENQLPFFLLEALYNECVLTTDLLRQVKFTEIVCKYFINSRKGIRNFIRRVDPDRNSRHFVDFLREHFIYMRYPRVLDDDSTTSSFQSSIWPPTVTELHDCGISFKVNKHNKDIEFVDDVGVLKLPQILVSEDYETQIRNLIAYEHCLPGSMDDVSNFAFFWSYLVNTNKDVRLLVNHGIIHNDLGSVEEVTKFFNHLCKHVPTGRNFYNTQCETMKSYCKRRRHRWMTSLKRDYFNTPWAFFSFTAALLLLALTLVQAVTGIVSLYK